GSTVGGQKGCYSDDTSTRPAARLGLTRWALLRVTPAHAMGGPELPALRSGSRPCGRSPRSHPAGVRPVPLRTALAVAMKPAEAGAALAGPIPTQFDISTFAEPATTSTMPKPDAVPWEKIARRLLRHERRPGKDGPGWTAARFRGGTTRANANVEA